MAAGHFFFVVIRLYHQFLGCRDEQKNVIFGTAAESLRASLRAKASSTTTRCFTGGGVGGTVRCVIARITGTECVWLSFYIEYICRLKTIRQGAG